MSSPATHEITISPAYDHKGERLAGKFNARFGQLVLTRDSSTPFYSSAQALLAGGLAKPDDVITMRHRGSQHTILRATVGAAARMAGAAPQALANASNAAGSYSVGERDPRRW
jgi:hypothetical protein